MEWLPNPAVIPPDGSGNPVFCSCHHGLVKDVILCKQRLALGLRLRGKTPSTLQLMCRATALTATVDFPNLTGRTRPSKAMGLFQI
jgi:hypothetical protein